MSSANEPPQGSGAVLCCDSDALVAQLGLSWWGEMAFFGGEMLFWVFFLKGVGCVVPLKAHGSCAQLIQGEL